MLTQHLPLNRTHFYRILLWVSMILSGEAVRALTLAEALQNAARHNEDVRIAAAGVARARAVRREAWANLLPAATVTYAYARRSAEIARTINDERVVLTPEESRSADLTVDLALFDFANLPRVQSAHADWEASRFDSASVYRDIAFEVATTYFEVLASERLAEAAAIRRQVAEQFVKDARDKVEAGLAARNELTRLELEMASAELARTQAENAVTQTRLLLESLMGQEIGDSLEQPAPLRTELSAGEYVARAPERPDFRAALLRTRAARAREREAWLEWLPDLGLRFVRLAPYDIAGVESSNDWQLSGTLSWELFQPRLIARTGLQRAEYLTVRERERAFRRRLVLESRTANADLQTARAALEQAEVRLRVAEQNAEEVRERFRLGLATAIEQADANVAEFESRAELARQQFALQQAILDRARADGYGPEDLIIESR